MKSKVISWVIFFQLFLLCTCMTLPANSTTLIPILTTDHENALYGKWQPSVESSSVSIYTDPETNSKYTHFPIKLTEKTSRNFWDIDLKTDLSGQQAVALRFKLDDVTPLKMLTVYFHGNEEWARSDISRLKEGWQTVYLPLDNFEREGSFSWDSIDRFRLSPWKATEGTSNLYFDKLEISTPSVLLVEVPNCPKPSLVNLSKSLDELGVKYATVTSASLKESIPPSVDLLVIPAAKQLPDQVNQSIKSFLDRQGKFIAFQGLPNKIAHQMGIFQGFQERVDQITMLSSGELFNCLPSPINFEGELKTWVEVTESSPTQVVARWQLADNSQGDPACLVGLDGALVTSEFVPTTAADGAAFLAVLINHYSPRQGKLIQSHLVENLAMIGEYTTLEELTTAIRGESRSHLKKDQINRLLAEAEEEAKEADLMKNGDDFCAVLSKSFSAHSNLLEAYNLVQRAEQD